MQQHAHTHSHAHAHAHMYMHIHMHIVNQHVWVLATHSRSVGDRSREGR